MDVEEAVAEARRILYGIDVEEYVSDDGWWETSFGAKFGAQKLAEIEALIRESFHKLLGGPS